MSYFVFAECSHFFVSCERLFNPGLEELPVIVLSADDTCVLALSEEAKKLGIKAGDAYSKIKAFCTRMNVIIFSANYKLYGDVSQRVMTLLSSAADEIEVNSIDEAFLKYSSSQAPDDILSACKEIRNKINKWVGVPLTMGIGPTKTLAKIANDSAKKERTAGVVDLTSSSAQKKILENYFIGDVWEIEPRLKEQLNAMGIRSAWEYCQTDPSLIRRRMGAFGEQMLWELRGVSSTSAANDLPKKSISYSRSFGKIIRDPKELGEALSTFVSGACAKLTEQKSCAKVLFLSLEAVLDENHGSRSTFSITASFPAPTNDIRQMIDTAKQCLGKLFAKNECYTKCGVMLLDLVPEKPDPILNAPPRRRKLLDTVDALNSFYDKNTLNYGAMGIDRVRKMTPGHSSQQPNSWKGLAFALAK